MFSIIDKIIEVPRWAKRLITLFIDISSILFSFFLALYVRVGEDWHRWMQDDIYTVLLLTILISLLIWVKLGLYRAVIRYLDVKALSSVFVGTLSSTMVFVALVFVFDAQLPRSVPFIFGAVILILVAGSRLLVRGVINMRQNAAKIPVVIYGAGSSGRQLCLSLQNGNEYNPVAFVDDERTLQKSTVSNVDVYGPERLQFLIDVYKIKTVLFAIPSISSDKKREIFTKVQNMNVDMLTIPGTADLVSGKVSVTQLRSVQIEELLGRDEVKPFADLLEKCLAEKTVLVTGAGGSIGSELCRKIVENSPKQLIIFEVSEYNLYAIEKELSSIAPDVTVKPILGSVTDEKLIERIFASFDIDTVYHAAAYKHVPLVEFNMGAGLWNNIWGTRVVAKAALKHKVSHFVLISTDKAVRPTNVMGTSKRLAELIIQNLADKSTDTVFSMVRFGNVLGSSGSVIPFFRKQIENGGPVTVTHPEINRYFMTIPEAASLVIQAGAMAEGGDVFVLDMGKPVKIADLAKNMIQLMGYTYKPDEYSEGDIEIVYSGLRPGEKLYEELLIGGDVFKTRHPRIMRANEIKLADAELKSLLDKIKCGIIENNAEQLRQLLIDAPTGFEPSTPLCDILNKASSVKKKQDNSTTENVHVLANSK